jgi:regulator-associated protein of mTOR
VASLFRNFLLAERIMAASNCTPVSYPRLPPTHQHPMWQVRARACEGRRAFVQHMLVLGPAAAC